MRIKWKGELKHLPIFLGSVLLLSVLLSPLIFLHGCTLFGGTSADEQARIIVGGFQTILPPLKAAGDAFIVAQPQYAPQWQAVGIPTFIAFNKLLASLEAQGAAGQPVTATTVLTQLQGQIAQIVTLYTQWGTIQPGTGGKPTPEQTALLIVTALNSGSILINELSGLFTGTIPAWTAIQAQNVAFQASLGYQLKLMKK